MNDNSCAIMPVGQRGVVASVSRQIAITEKVLGRIQSVQNLLAVFNVPQDGSFEEAIIRIRPDGLILLAAGRYILDAGVTINKPLRIVGAGRDAIIIESSVRGTIICVDMDGLFAMENVGILRTGEHIGDLFSISAREVSLKSCALTGNSVEDEDEENFDDDVDYWWGGIRIAGSTVGVVEDSCVICCMEGIIVEKGAEIQLHSNKCNNNLCSGISIRSAHAIVVNNICSLNGCGGIYVSSQSKADLTGNRCEENDYYGINYCYSATGTAENNICRLNKGHGIEVSEHSTVNLTSNRCEVNEGSGIRVSTQSNADLTGNRCAENEYDGIDYYDSATGTAKNNICRLNANRGITVVNSKVDLADNRCEENGHRYDSYCNYCEENSVNGIRYCKSAIDTEENNFCPDVDPFDPCNPNEGAGILFHQSSGKAENNICRLNGGDGLSVEYESQADLTTNRCEENWGDGIFFRASSGKAESNICRFNKAHGISVEKHSKADLMANRCEENGLYGIRYSKSATGTEENNICRLNKHDGE